MSKWAGGIGPLDEYPIHQAPLPVTWAASSDRNFYDRSYFNAHDRTGDIFCIFGHGYYPNLGTKDAFFLVRRGDTQTAVHFGDPIDDDRLNQHVGAYRCEVVEPLQQDPGRLRRDRGHRRRPDLGRARSPSLREQPHVMRAGSRVTLDAQRFAQLGSWSGTIVVDGEEIDVTPDRWLGSRDRSWGIRPVGEALPAGAPGEPRVRGHVVALRPDGLRRLRDRPDHPGGARRAPHAQRLHPDLEGRPGRAARLAAGQDPLHLRHPDPDRRLDHLHHPRGQAGPARGRVPARRPDPRRWRLRR